MEFLRNIFLDFVAGLPTAISNQSAEPVNDLSEVSLGPRVAALSDEEERAIRDGDFFWPAHFNYLSAYDEE